MIAPPKKVLIETSCLCNRNCQICLRRNDPTRSRWSKTWLGEKKTDKKMPSELVYDIIDQIPIFETKIALGFVWFNEPLLDERLPEFVRYSKDKGIYTYTTTNGDYLTPELANELDGVLDHIAISLYDYLDRPNLMEEEEERFKSYFKKTKVFFQNNFITTHFGPKNIVNDLITKHSKWRCLNPQSRLIITYSGEMALCCEDIACNWKLGNVKDKSLIKLWYSPKHIKIIEILNSTGGRYAYSYCEICPTCGAL